MLFRVIHEKCTPHYCITHDLAKVVGADLVARFGGRAEIEGPLAPVYKIDFGGMILSVDTDVKFNRDGVDLSFWAHQHFQVAQKLKLGLKNIRAGNYIKVHGRWSSVCIPVPFAEEFVKWLGENEEELNSMVRI